METATLVMDRPHHSPWPSSYQHDPRPGWLQPAQRPQPLELPEALRSRIAARMVMANFQLAHSAGPRRRSDPIGPHATIYLYTNGGTDLRLAYRTFVAADEPRLPHLLHELIPHVRTQ